MMYNTFYITSACRKRTFFFLFFCLFDQKEALMKQVAHQAVVMQFILEVASHSQQDPRGCFRQFFHKAKVGQCISGGGD